jgi:hypothetical protein
MTIKETHSEKVLNLKVSNGIVIEENQKVSKFSFI